MTAFRTCASIALGLWVGGLSFFAAAVLPRLFRTLPKEEAGRVAGLLFPAADRWGLGWGTVACASLALFFLNRHLEPRSLVLELPVLAAWLLTLHSATIQHPQVWDLQRKLQLPEYRGTAHLEKLKFAFQRMHHRSVQVQTVILALGWLALGLVPAFLR